MQARYKKWIWIFLVIVLVGKVGVYYLYTQTNLFEPKVHGNPPGAQPYQNAEVQDFVTHNLAAVLDFRAASGFDAHANDIKPYVTDEGIRNLRKHFAELGWTGASMTTQMRFLKTPEVTGTYYENGRWLWMVEAPVEITLSENGQATMSKFLAGITVCPAGEPLAGSPTEPQSGLRFSIMRLNPRK